MQDLQEFLSPIDLSKINDDREYNDGQFGKNIRVNEGYLPDLDGVDMVIVGITETRGGGTIQSIHSADAIRSQFYQLHRWHTDIAIADVGNIISGVSIQDSYSAAKIVIEELIKLNKKVVVLGGAHDNTLAQYLAYKGLDQTIEATVIDAKIDLKSSDPLPAENFLMEMLTSEPNIVKHYNHIGFQSYLVHPQILEVIDKLRFDCFRVGMAKEDLEAMEPVIRNSHLVSFDLSCIKHSDAPGSAISPNGFSGEEACTLARYVGMSPHLSSFGIYNYKPESDYQNLTAKQIAQMLWYFIDGLSRGKEELSLSELGHFNQYHTAFAEVDTIFYQSKKTGRWWMQMPDKNLIACAYSDYLQASSNEIPERWLRVQERDA